MGKHFYSQPAIMERNVEMDTDAGRFTISGGASRIQEKIEVVQQVLTLLEDTMSCAKSTHQKNQDSYQARINELELQIQNLRNEMQRDREDFADTSGSLGDDIQQYLNLENKLLTIEERSHDDYVVLPELSASTDIHIAQYLSSKYTEWQRLKLQCQVLNQGTQNSFRDNICVKRYQISVESTCESTERYLKAMEKANALNLFRGKKYVSGSPYSPPSRFVSLTWYKDETAARDYAQRNYRTIIEHVFKEQYDEYKGRHIDIIELQNPTDLETSLLATELTIHVQPKTTSSTLTANSMPKKITLYQFDAATTYIPPAVTTINVETAPPPTDESVEHEREHLSLVPIMPDQREYETSLQDREANKPYRVAKRRSKKFAQKISSKTVDILSMIGFDDTRQDNISNDVAIPSTSKDCTRIQTQCSPIPRMELQPVQSVINTNQTRPEQSFIAHCIDDIGATEWTLEYIYSKGIEKLTNVQKQLIQSFKMPGDIHYEGVANGGKTTGMIIGLLNRIDLKKDCVQALIITSNSRSSKLIQKMTEFDGGRHSILCQRIDELIDTKDPKPLRCKTIRKPSCHILVGTLEEMKVFVLKNLVHKDAIRFLILHKAEEIYGSTIDKQKQNALAVNQTLYALDATVKVVVVRRTMTRCAELDTFCERKLRQKQFLNETMDMAEFLNVRSRHLSCGAKSSTASESGISEVNLEIVEAETDDSEEPEKEWRTFISSKAMHLFGISRNIENDEADHVPEYLNDDITHFYANIETDEESSKIDMISVLNLEEDKAIIFCDSIEKAEWISTRLRQNKLWPQVIHEDVLPKDQKAILQNYRRGSFCRVLICTDFLTSISLDSADVVLNYDLPKSKSVYISRAAFAVRRIRSCKSANGDTNTKAVVVNLIMNEFQALWDFEKSMGITIQNCED